jgi:MurNAc alpha-1-phosphate uridylyltransferase
MTLTCLVLAGGLGTRMADFTKSIPKILIPVGGRPFLHHQLDLLEQQGFSKVVLALGYLGSMVVEELERHPHPCLQIDFVFDGDIPLGTGGATRSACENNISDKFFFITYGDSYLLFNPRVMVSEFNDTQYEAVMALYSNSENLDRNNARISQDLSVTYKKNVPNPEEFGLNMIDFGISYVSRESIMRVIPADVSYDLAQYFQEISIEQKLQGLISKHRFYEIGSYDGRDELELHLADQKITHDELTD